MTDLRNPVDGIAERLLASDLGSDRDGQHHLARYLFAAHWAPGKACADVCCGVGYGAGILRSAGAREVYGLDVSTDAVRAASTAYGADASLRFIVADATEPLPIPPVDLAVCFEGIEHVETPDLLLLRLRERLAPAGTAIVSTPNGAISPGGHSGNPHHRSEFHGEEFESMLARHFRTVRMFGQWSAGDPSRDSPRGQILRMGKGAIPHTVRRTVKPALRSVRRMNERRGGERPDDPLLGRPQETKRVSRRTPRGWQPHLWVAVCTQPHD